MNRLAEALAGLGCIAMGIWCNMQPQLMGGSWLIALGVAVIIFMGDGSGSDE